MGTDSSPCGDGTEYPQRTRFRRRAFAASDALWLSTNSRQASSRDLLPRPTDTWTMHRSWRRTRRKLFHSLLFSNAGLRRESSDSRAVRPQRLWGSGGVQQGGEKQPPRVILQNGAQTHSRKFDNLLEEFLGENPRCLEDKGTLSGKT